MPHILGTYNCQLKIVVRLIYCFFFSSVQDIILSHLLERYLNNQIYTYIGDILIAVNPLQTLNLYGPEVSLWIFLTWTFFIEYTVHRFLSTAMSIGNTHFWHWPGWLHDHGQASQSPACGRAYHSFQTGLWPWFFVIWPGSWCKGSVEITDQSRFQNLYENMIYNFQKSTFLQSHTCNTHMYQFSILLSREKIMFYLGMIECTPMQLHVGLCRPKLLLVIITDMVRFTL